MNHPFPVKELPTSSPNAAKRSHGILIVVGLVAALLGGGDGIIFSVASRRSR
jgi:hypothetical protein